MDYNIEIYSYGNKNNKDLESFINDGKSSISVYKNNKYKFTESSNLNIMDYNGEKKTYAQWQWIIMQNDVKSYYGNITENK